jgi:tetratricopeptide (TPR) repeat protein
MQRAAGHESEDISLALNNLGMCYVRSGKYLEAQPSEPQDFFYATILNNIAELRLGLGNDDEALRLCEESLQLRERIGNPEKLGRSYITMATVLARRGDGTRAEEFFTKALGNRESVYGVEHPELILTLRRYSDWLKSQARADEAAAMDSRIANICRRYDIPITRT